MTEYNGNLYKSPEILAPTGTMQSVVAALNGGCDAIYIGGKFFNARAYADNPSNEELREIIKKCHLVGVKVFVTLNILYKESEISGVLDFVSCIDSYGADAVIVQDLGIFNLIKQNFPELKVSASTQMTVHNSAGVAFVKRLGFDRVVLSRELGLDEIKKIRKENPDIELEVFVHGALCVCYSGRCLMSSVIGQRSGNRGRCAQPCRMEYSLVKCKGKGRMNVKSGYLLSPKDISTATMIDELVQSGVDSLKIEGRMKAPEYVARVISFYRKYVDEACVSGDNKVSSDDIRELTQIFNRGGSSYTGYYHTYAGTDMMSSSPKSSGVRIGTVAEYDKARRVCTINLTAEVTGGDGIEVWTQKGPHTGTNISHKAAAGSTIRLHLDGNVQKGDAVFLSYDKRLNDKLKTTYARTSRQRRVYVDFKAVQGKELCISVPEFGVSVSGSVVQAAQNQPMDGDRIRTQLKKTGGTPFEFCLNNCEIGDNIYISISELNELRRKACKELEEKINSCYTREKKFVRAEKYMPNKAEIPKISVLVSTADQFKAALDSKPDRIYYVPENAKDLQKATSAAHKNGIELFAALPYVSRDCNADNKEFVDECAKTSVNGFMLRSYMDVKTQKRIACDYTLNIMNSCSINAAKTAFGAESVTLSPELNLKELKALAGEDTEVVVYGRLPLMTTQQCPIGLYCGEKKNGKFCSEKGKNDSYVLRDRKNAEFPIKPQCSGCYAMIYNSAPVYMLGKAQDVLAMGAGMLRLEFTTEDYDTTKKIIEEHKRVLCDGEKVTLVLDEETTKGHFYRGVN